MSTKPFFRGMLNAACICLLLAACKPKPVTVETHNKDGVQFSFPSDWVVAKDALLKGRSDIRSIQIEGPDNAVICLICVPPTSTQTLEDYAASVASARAEAIDKKLSVGSLKFADTSKGTSEPTTANVGGHEVKGIHQHFSVSLLGKEVPHDATFFSIVGTQYKLLITVQVAEKHLQTSRGAIDSILDSIRIDGAK